MADTKHGNDSKSGSQSGGNHSGGNPSGGKKSGQAQGRAADPKPDQRAKGNRDDETMGKGGTAKKSGNSAGGSRSPSSATKR